MLKAGVQVRLRVQMLNYRKVMQVNVRVNSEKPSTNRLHRFSRFFGKGSIFAQRKERIILQLSLSPGQ